MKFTSFHMGLRVTISTLSKNHIYSLNSFSALEEAVRFLNSYEESHKTKIIHEHMICSSIRKFGTKIV